MSGNKPRYESLCDQLQAVFDGEPWYGDSLIAKLEMIRAEVEEPSDLNKTASYVQHLINWRQFVIKKLIGDIDFDITLNTTADWTDINIEHFEAWDHLLELLRDTQNQLVTLIRSLSNEVLIKQVPGKDYSFEHMLHGLIQHEVYHTGQIAVYWKNR
ncbi:MAG: DinB family protein [Cytophagales bacterium]|nr:DinB family protein [Cytophagales bacterium]